MYTSSFLSLYLCKTKAETTGYFPNATINLSIRLLFRTNTLYPQKLLDTDLEILFDYRSLLITPPPPYFQLATVFPRCNAINVISPFPGDSRWCAVSPVRARNEQSQGTPEEQSPHDTAGRLDVVQIGGPPSFRTLARSFVRSLARPRVSRSSSASACELNACACMCVICFRPLVRERYLNATCAHPKPRTFTRRRRVSLDVYAR